MTTDDLTRTATACGLALGVTLLGVAAPTALQAQNDRPATELDREAAAECVELAAEIGPLRDDLPGRRDDIDALAADYEEKRAELERYPNRDKSRLEAMREEYNMLVEEFREDQERYNSLIGDYNSNCGRTTVEWSVYKDLCEPYTDEGNIFCEGFGGFWTDLEEGNDPTASD